MFIESIRNALAPTGLNLLDCAPVDRYEASLPTALHLRPHHPMARSIVVIGQGGGAFWRFYEAQGAAFFTGAHPFDSFTVACVERVLQPVLARMAVDWRCFYPFRFGHQRISFQHLAAAAGLGVPSVLGLLLHPVYGPWMALRAAVSVNVPMPGSPLQSFDPCHRCHEQPCRAACPGGALSASRGWDATACARHRLRAVDDCADGCHARVACVYGQPHRYPLTAQRHHQRASLLEMRRHAA